jgi:hypothetical protein
MILDFFLEDDFEIELKEENKVTPDKPAAESLINWRRCNPFEFSIDFHLRRLSISLGNELLKDKMFNPIIITLNAI